jgi:hypothetical protein
MGWWWGEEECFMMQNTKIRNILAILKIRVYCDIRADSHEFAPQIGMNSCFSLKWG